MGFGRMSAPSCVLVHCAHHKIGTVWWGNILGAVASRCGVSYGEVSETEFPESADVYLFRHSRDFDRSCLAGRPFRGTHMIRDPRDVIVSGYFYHLWTTEPWANRPNARYGGRSYREELNRLDQHDGLLLEIERIWRDQLRDMLAWDYSQPEFLELRYENVIVDDVGSFEQVFRHFGFADHEVSEGLRIVEQMSFRRVAGRKVGQVGAASHLRSGRPGEWREHFTADHLDRWQELGGDAAVAKLGYDAA